MTNPEDMLNQGFEIHPELLVTQKHSESGCSSYTGHPGTTFTLQTERDLAEWSGNRNKFNVWGSTDSSTAYLYVVRKDGQPIGTNGEIFAQFCSGLYQGTHGWPMSATSSLPSSAVPLYFDDVSKRWKR